jgi:hypothetical protein
MRFVSAVVIFALAIATAVLFLHLEGMSWWAIFHLL